MARVIKSRPGERCRDVKRKRRETVGYAREYVNTGEERTIKRMVWVRREKMVWRRLGRRDRTREMEKLPWHLDLLFQSDNVGG
jgi:hypothetical protein